MPDAETIATLIDGTLGEGSPFDETFGYYAHGVGERTACLPDGWEERAITLRRARVSLESSAFVRRSTTSRFSKLCAWREKDRSWLEAGLNTGVLSLEVMKARSRTISNPNAPDAAEIDRRIEQRGGECRSSGKVRPEALTDTLRRPVLFAPPHPTALSRAG